MEHGGRGPVMGVYDLGPQSAGRMRERQAAAGSASMVPVGTHGDSATFSEPSADWPVPQAVASVTWAGHDQQRHAPGSSLSEPVSGFTGLAAHRSTQAHSVGFDGFRVSATFLAEQDNLVNLQVAGAGALSALPEGFTFHPHLPKSDDVENSLRGGEGVSGDPRPVPWSSELEAASLDRGPKQRALT
eukprot:558698-Rhodomonas_salina.2